ncbi:MAG: sporulation integral membrane protein YtvI, partial [Tyzzerella sp.]|nr:sporulation integral membrane protein YtvI [Tyzzerella sp.]
MKDTRPYWKVIVSLVFSLIATILFVVIGYSLLRLFLPFVIGWIIAFIANPMVCWLEKRLKIVKKLGSAITIVVVLGAVVGVIYLV